MRRIQAGFYFFFLVFSINCLSGCTNNEKKDTDSSFEIKRQMQYSQNYENFPDNNIFEVDQDTGFIEIPLELISESEPYEMGILILLDGIAQQYQTENNSMIEYIHRFAIGSGTDVNELIRFIPIIEDYKVLYDLSIVFLVYGESEYSTHEIQALNMGRKSYAKLEESYFKTDGFDEKTAKAYIQKSVIHDIFNQEDLIRDFYINTTDYSGIIKIEEGQVLIELEAGNSLGSEYRGIMLIDERPALIENASYFDFVLKDNSAVDFLFYTDGEAFKENSQIIFIISDQTPKEENGRVTVLKSNTVYIRK